MTSCQFERSIQSSPVSYPEKNPFTQSSDEIAYGFVDRVVESVVDLREQLLDLFISVFPPCQIETDYATTSEVPAYYIPTETNLNSLKFLDKLSFPDMEGLQNFFHRHTDILPLVVSECQEAVRLFGDDAEYSLEVSSDRESEFEYLVLYIRKPKYEDDIMEKIQNLCLSYWAETADKSTHFLITTDFDEPGFTS